MKYNKLFIAAVMLVSLAPIALGSCKKGSDDPIVSLKTRNDRFSNTWTLNKYEKNGVTQDLNGSSYVYTVQTNGTLVRTVEGSIFGFPTKTESSGTWSFLNDDEDVKIVLGSENTTYNIQRLATKELWLKTISGSDTYMYYFTGL